MRDELKPMQPWGPNERTIWVGEHNPITGRLPVHIPNNGPNPGGTFLTDQLESFTRERNAEEYAAGFRARMADIPDTEAADPAWRAGWNDADTEMLEQARHRRWIEEGREDDYPGTRHLLFDAGRLARENGVLFDEARTQPWKAGWVAADIQIGEELTF